MALMMLFYKIQWRQDSWTNDCSTGDMHGYKIPMHTMGEIFANRPFSKKNQKFPATIFFRYKPGIHPNCNTRNWRYGPKCAFLTLLRPVTKPPCQKYFSKIRFLSRLWVAIFRAMAVCTFIDSTIFSRWRRC
jgi:hypothetical protein